MWGMGTDPLSPPVARLMNLSTEVLCIAPSCLNLVGIWTFSKSYAIECRRTKEWISFHGTESGRQVDGKLEPSTCHDCSRADGWGAKWNSQAGSWRCHTRQHTGAKNIARSGKGHYQAGASTHLLRHKICWTPQARWAATDVSVKLKENKWRRAHTLNNLIYSVANRGYLWSPITPMMRPGDTVRRANAPRDV